MWQRVQTLFLLLASAGMVTAIFLPWYVHVAPSGRRYVLAAFSAEVGRMAPVTVYLGWACIISAALSLAAVVMYKQRAQQMSLCMYNFFAIVAVFLMALYHVQMLFDNLPGPEGDYTLGAYAVVTAMLFNWLARFFIRRDERIVQDADKLR